MKTKCLKSMTLSVMLFLLIFILNSFVYMTKNMFAAAMASIVEDGVMTKSQTGLISAMFWLVYGIFQFIGGFLSDKYNPYKLVTIGVVSGIISNIIIYFNQNFPVVMAVWCLNAALQFGLWPGCFKIASSQIKLEFRETAIFWILLSTSVGQALSMLVASFVGRWQDNFLVSAVVLVFILLFWVILYKYLEKNMVETEAMSTEFKSEMSPVKISMKELALKSGLPGIFIICFLINTVANGMKTITPVMLMESYDSIPASVANRLGVVLIVFATLGMFLSGIFRNKVTKHEMKGALILLFVSVPALLFSIFIGKVSYIVILILLSFAMAFIQGALPFANTFTSARFTYYGRGGTVSGILNGALAMGNVVSSYLYARMAETLPWSSVTAVWTFGALAAALIAAFMTRLWSNFIKR